MFMVNTFIMKWKKIASEATVPSDKDIIMASFENDVSD